MCGTCAGGCETHVHALAPVCAFRVLIYMFYILFVRNFQQPEGRLDMSNDFELLFQVMVEDSVWLDSFDNNTIRSCRTMSGISKAESHKAGSLPCTSSQAGTVLLPRPPSSGHHPQEISPSYAATTIGLLKRASQYEFQAINRSKRPRSSTSESSTPSRGGAISIQQLLN